MSDISAFTPCLVCNKEMTQISDYSEINDGTSFDIDCQYGSKYEFSSYMAIVCDDCLKSAIDKGSVILTRKLHI